MKAVSILYTLVQSTPKGEIRHLLLHLVDGSHSTNLSHLSAGVETTVATGTEYEMRQRADALMQEWTKNDGFRLPRKGELVFESLGHTAALATAAGYTIVYDPRQKSLANFTGEVRLSEWPGVIPKTGEYVYALDGMKIVAQPKLPPNHGLNMWPKTPEETLAVMSKAIDLRKSIGQDAEFILGGN